MLKTLLRILITLSCITTTYALSNNPISVCPIQLSSVPFQQVIAINPNCLLQVNYNFGPHLLIFCYTTNLQTNGELAQNIGQVIWPYKGRPNSGTLPLTLKTNGNFEGSFADASGTIIVQNNTSTTLSVSCVYSY